MKTIYTIITGILLLSANISTAQSTVIAETNEINDVKANSRIMSSDELPAVGVRYYYYPNLDAYFDTHKNLYIYEQQGQWVKSKEIVSGYRGYSIYNGTRFEITDYNGDQPYTRLADHRKQFPKKYSSRRQPPAKIHAETKVALN